MAAPWWISMVKRNGRCDTTNFYIYRKLEPYTNVKVSIIARGISVGDELEYTDEVTLGRSIQNRTIFEGK